MLWRPVAVTVGGCCHLVQIRPFYLALNKPGPYFLLQRVREKPSAVRPPRPANWGSICQHLLEIIGKIVETALKGLRRLDLEPPLK